MSEPDENVNKTRLKGSADLAARWGGAGIGVEKVTKIDRSPALSSYSGKQPVNISRSDYEI
jgi:hypothetical protein